MPFRLLVCLTSKCQLRQSGGRTYGCEIEGKTQLCGQNCLQGLCPPKNAPIIPGVCPNCLLEAKLRFKR